MTSRDAHRLAYAAMVLALTVACTPTSSEPAPAAAPAAEAPPIAAPADTASGPAVPNTEDTLAAAPSSEPAAAPAPQTPAAPAAAKPDLALGVAAYTRTCAMCHGPTGQGTAMAKAIATTNVEAIKEKMVKGMINPGDKMPPMGASLSAEEQDAVAHYVAGGFKAPH